MSSYQETCHLINNLHNKSSQTIITNETGDNNAIRNWTVENHATWQLLPSSERDEQGNLLEYNLNNVINVIRAWTSNGNRLFVCKLPIQYYLSHQ